jgi:response regulator of citrate/malate metabolism
MVGMSDAIRTLVVDDDYMVAEIHRGFVERVPGFKVVGVAHGGREALDAIERLYPDLLILDIYLPDLTGLAVLDELRRNGNDVDAIMVTAAKDVASIQQAMHRGALHYIVKPFDFARFRQTLENFRRFCQERSAREILGQRDIDRLYRMMTPTLSVELPKGLNRPTLELVVHYLAEQRAPKTAQEVADGTGVSRGTARRYLEYLEQQGQARLELRYGSTGRPEHLYSAPGTDASEPAVSE